MSFTGNEGEFISLTAAADLTANYRNANSSNPSLILGHYLGKSKLQSLLNQTGCKGLRIYHGMSSTNTPEVVIVGVDSNGNDMISGTNPLILDQSVLCPPTCSSTNSLNS